MDLITRARRKYLIGQGSKNRDHEDAQLCILRNGSQLRSALCGRTIEHIWPYIPVECVGNPDREWCPRCKEELERLKKNVARSVLRQLGKTGS